ncbi:hypothetical protein CHO01_21870 [Cellulomonas hominis]|uniref:Uncharacterized protein n=1 Tax=Cellulomonas hominis TaxID=156981 RepID=A0A511FCV3_9CELL|nr:hypothetical protein [Cellulomonas hominis]MBB5474690.1 hypothetical protein [Cellulomonas hominis]NKY05755.1 hypothetical protein [Cellulomonas hominis]GEL47071.1 hypothetical protein CHO01_21870 [Cellulomonas hominis]
MSRIPQHATSTDPNVLAALEVRALLEAEFRIRALDFAHEHGGPDASAKLWRAPDRHGDGTIIVLTGIGAARKPATGSWTRHRDGWRPYKSDPLHQAMSTIRATLPGAPGLPNIIDGGRDDRGRHWTLYPDPILVGDAAWFGLSMPPAAEQPDGVELGPQWVEATGSAYAAAADAVRS